jgi:hypothetical protein
LIEELNLMKNRDKVMGVILLSLEEGLLKTLKF